MDSPPFEGEPVPDSIREVDAIRYEIADGVVACLPVGR